IRPLSLHDALPIFEQPDGFTYPTPFTALLTLEQAGVDQLLQMMRNRRLRQAERRLKLARTYRLRVRRERIHDPHARAGSPSALNSDAVAAASASESAEAASGAQQATGSNTALTEGAALPTTAPSGAPDRRSRSCDRPRSRLKPRTELTHPTARQWPRLASASLTELFSAHCRLRERPYA